MMQTCHKKGLESICPRPFANFSFMRVSFFAARMRFPSRGKFAEPSEVSQAQSVGKRWMDYLGSPVVW